MATESFSIRKLTNPSTQERDRILHILLSAFRGDLEIAALTGGRTALEAPFFRSQIANTLAQGEIYVASSGDEASNIVGVSFAYPPGKDFIPEPTTHYDASQEYVSRLSPEMQQWWTTHLRPKYEELTTLGLGSSEVRKAAWYVRIIAVHPDKHRRGIARRLLENIQHKADPVRHRMVIEAHTDVLVRIFSKFGFKVKATKNFGSYQGGFPMFLMLREPKS